MNAETDSVLTEVGGRHLSLSNLDKALYPDGFTKAEVINHYLSVAEVMLPHLAGRCITRSRYPHGTDHSFFFEKNAPQGTPSWVHVEQVQATESLIDYVVADEVATLVWLANLAALELHTPQWRITDAPQQPVVFDGPNAVRASTLVVDLDPGPGIRPDQIAEAAMLAATELAEQGLVPFVKASGSKGMQVVSPIQPTPWREVMEQVRRLGHLLASRHPKLFVTQMAKQARVDRIYLDHLQNRADRNTVAVYSLRGRERPTVSAPLSWDEVAAIGPTDDFQPTSEQVIARLASQGDLWASINDPDLAGLAPDWPPDPPS